MNDYMNDPNLLREIIMDHYKYPRNKHLMAEADNVYCAHMAADSCIDDIKVMAKVKNGIIEDVCFDGVACVISTASTSIMTELLKNKSVAEAKQIIATYNQMINLEPFNDELLAEAVAFSQVGKQANRIGCATIGWRAISQIIFESED